MDTPNEITLSAQGRFLKLRVCGGGNRVGGGQRGNVSAFSRSSRLRLLQKMATIKANGLNAVFLTLTYGQEFPAPRQAKRHLDSFLKRISRRYANVSAIWRMEFQKRGAPHFHLLLFNLPFVQKEHISLWWGEVVGVQFWDTASFPIRPPFTRIEKLYSQKHAARYVAKYVAKVEGANGGFNIASYLTDKGEFIHPVTGENSGSIGRWWGVYNAEALPLADLVEIIANGAGTIAVNALRRALAAIRWRVEPDSRFGFFLFEDNPYLWADYFEELLR